MATYSKTFAHIGRAKRADYRRRRQQALALLALALWHAPASTASSAAPPA